MACDERLVERIRGVLKRTANVRERRMFGGVCFTLNGNMFCGVVKDEIMVRVGPAQYLSALRTPHAREMDFTGQPMAGYVFVEKEGFASESALRKWLHVAEAFVSRLPAKTPLTANLVADSHMSRPRHRH
jgi:TfoX/Sxy family transcriptional regulator of competence genes